MRRVVFLCWFTIAYNVVEGIVSMGFGWTEGSTALFGFGADSFIEVFSAILVLWRFRGQFLAGTLPPLERERKATVGIGLLFLALAIGTGVTSALQIVAHQHPETTVPGVVISALSLSFMFWLWKSKLRAGKALESPTVLSDAACSLACIQLSVVLFLGSLVYLVFPNLWWIDSVAAVLLTILIGKEGWETIGRARSEEFDGGGCCGRD